MPPSFTGGIADLEQRFLDDGADIHAVLAGDAIAHDVNEAGAVAKQAAVAVIGRERVAAILDEAEDVIEILSFQHAVRLNAPDFVVQFVRAEGPGAGDAHDVLGQHVEATGAGRVTVEFAGRDPGDGGLAFQHLEAVGRDQDGARDFIHPVIGAADPLQQAGHPFGRTDLQDLIDPAPVDAEVE